LLYFLIIIGLIFGSFLNVLIYRLPKNLSIIYPPSFCPYCNKSILWYYNIPLISFLFLKGKSFCCNRKISIQYPIVETLSALLWVWSYYYIFSINNQILFLIISSCLLVIIFTDYFHFFIPIQLNILMLTSCLLSFFYLDISVIKIHFFSMLLLSSYFFIIMSLIKIFTKKDTMGYGDIILIGAISFWLGWIDAMFIIFLSSITSLIHWVILILVTKQNNIQLPFGSSIAFITILFYIIKESFQISTNLF